MSAAFVTVHLRLVEPNGRGPPACKIHSCYMVQGHRKVLKPMRRNDGMIDRPEEAELSGGGAFARGRGEGEGGRHGASLEVSLEEVGLEEVGLKEVGLEGVGLGEVNPEVWDN